MRGWILLCLGIHAARCGNLWKEVKGEAEKEWRALQENLHGGLKPFEEEVNSLWAKANQAESKPLKEEDESSEEVVDNTNVKQGDVIVAKHDSSEESAEDDREGDEDIDRCSQLCQLQSGHEKLILEKKPASSLCAMGCRGQGLAFRSLQATFQQTPPDMLLGTALDKCWDGCLGQRDTGSRALCSTGCQTMKNLLKKKIAAADTVKEIEAKKEVENKDTEMENKDKDFNEANKEKVNDLSDKGAPEEEAVVKPHVVTYVLWRPHLPGAGFPSFTQDDAYQSYSRMVNIVHSLLQHISEETKASEDESEQNRGWRGDRMQLRIPETQDLSSSVTDDSVYARLTDSLDSIKQKVQRTMAAPDFQQNMYYILIGISALLLIATAFNSLGHRRSPRDTVEDHYYLTEPSMGARLPSYDDCVKADKDLVAGITSQEAYPTKENLPLPTFVVMEAVVAPAVTITEPANKEEAAPADNKNVA